MRLLLLVFVLLAASPPDASPTPAPSAQCDYDRHVYDLGFRAFDQDMSGGWRALADRQGCEGKAADILRAYRERYLSVIPLLYWHEAQLRASSGENEEAISLMRQSREPDGADLSGWNPYVDATIAFLRNDKAGFADARNRLQNFKKPIGWPADAEWPQNTNVVAGLWNCFGKPYKIAYASSCRPATKRHSIR